MRNLKKTIGLTLIACTIILGGCKPPSMLRDIAYDVNKKSGYTVYIAENEEYVPYLVLTKDYNGNCLLLRERLLDEPRRYHPNGRYAAYYETSEIDGYLNNEFFDTLSSEVRNIIINSEIVITAKESLAVCGTETKTIERAVFLLSYSELGGEKSSTKLVEGKQLSYFKSDDSRIARYSSNRVGSWTLRTVNTWEDNFVCGVTIDGVAGSGGIGGGLGDYVNGIRPAFCLPGDTAIYTDEVDGETVYFIRF